MKLLFCGSCNDIVKMVLNEWRYCQCGNCYGRYEDKLNASVGGDDCVVFGIDNTSLISALRRHNKDPNTKNNDFKAFVISKDTETVDFD